MKIFQDQVEKILEALQKIASGDYEARIEHQENNDDLDAVASGINMLAEELKARMQSEKEKSDSLLFMLENLEKSKLELEQSEAKYRYLVESIQEGFATVDGSEKFLFVNPAGAKIFGFTKPDQLVGKNIREFTTAEDYQAVQQYTITSKRNISSKYDLSITGADGVNRIIQVLSQPVFHNHEFQYNIGVFRDVTETRLLEKEVFDSNSVLNKIMDSVSNVIFVLDEKGYFSHVNKAVEKLTGYKAEELIGKSYHLFVADAKRERIKKTIELVMKFHNSANNEELEIRRKDGKKIMLSINISPLIYENGETNIVGVAEDISQRYKFEQALLNSEMRFKSLFDETPISIWEEDFSAAYFYVQELKAKGITDFKTYFQNNRQEAIDCSQKIKILDINQATLSLFKARSKQDLQINLDEIFTKESIDTFIGQLISISKGETKYEGECVNRTIDGNSIYVFLRWNVAPGYESDYSKVLVSLIDITLRKKTEIQLKNHQEQLELINKILRHDLTNNLAVIKSAIRIFKENPQYRLLDEASACVDKSADLIMKMREHEALITKTNLKVFSLHEIVKKVMSQYPEIPYVISGRCEILASDTLESVIDNIVSNAIIHGKTDQLDFEITKHAQTCELHIKDFGKGISSEHKEHIFDEGYYFGDTGNTGMGLFIVKKAIERFGGSVRIEDNEPQGVIFVLEFKKIR